MEFGIISPPAVFSMAQNEVYRHDPKPFEKFLSSGKGRVLKVPQF